MTETSGESRNARIDRGYHALKQGLWQQAEEIFNGLLAEDPHCGMSCLGRAMAAKQLHGRRELADNWAWIQSDPDFLEAVEPAKADFLPWLRRDMAAAQAEAPDSGFHFDGLSDLLLEFSILEPGRKLLLSFAAVQVLLYLMVAGLFLKADPGTGSFWPNLLGALMISAIMTGLPVVFGPLYANSILEDGRFCRILKILNTVICVIGCLICAILVAAFRESSQAESIGFRENRYYEIAYAVAFAIHLLSLIAPVFLRKFKDLE